MVQALNNFLMGVQKRALVQAEIATGNRDEALDILQDAMIKLAKSYADQPENWAKIFQRILQNGIRDWYRKKKVRKILVWWEQAGDAKNNIEETLHEDASEAGFDLASSNTFSTPESILIGQQSGEKVMRALRQLPPRQQQAFLLRAWWEHDTQTTAQMMQCSEGSVKTHYSRALNKLKELLEPEQLTQTF